MRIVYLGFILLSISAPTFAQKIYLLKQWHLQPSVSTLDIKLSQKLAQSENQLDLYQKAKSLVEENQIKTVLSEGCEKNEINESFSLRFNQWNYSALKKMLDKPEYEKILTLLPMKLKVWFAERIKSYCVDDLSLIKESELALSDLRAYVGYAMRLEEFKKKQDVESYQRYAKALEIKDKHQDPMEFAKEKALAAVTQFEQANNKRNLQFVKNIQALKIPKEQAAAFVIGGHHAKNLSELLKQQGFEVEVYTPKGYGEPQEDLVEKLKEGLGKNDGQKK